MCLNVLLLCLLLLNQTILSLSTITGEQYASIPPLFRFDDYDECLYIKEAIYCTMTFQIYPENSSDTSEIWNIINEISSKPSNYRHDLLRHGVCLSGTCPNKSNITDTTQHKEIISSLTRCYNNKYSYAGLVGNVVNIYCENKNPQHPIDIYDMLFAFFIMTYMVFVTFASLYEGIARYKPPTEYEKITGRTFGKFVSMFSIPKNFSKLKTIDEKNRLGCMQGIRFYNMMTVFLAHALMVHFGVPVANPVYTETINENILNSFVTNGGYVVQTFFLMSGWLLTYHIFVTFNGDKVLKLRHLFTAFLLRYLRLTPTLFVIVAFHCTWLAHFSRGPFWNKIIGEEHARCRKNWWTNLLYINNFVNKEEMCLLQTWYLATELQLFALSLIIIFLMKKYERFVKYLIGIAITISILVPFTICYVQNYDILVRYFPESLYNFLLPLSHWHGMYTASYSNITGYTIGIMFGYIYYKIKEKNLGISKVYIILWWILILSLPITTILSAGIIVQTDIEYTQAESALYWAFGKNLFALGIGTAIFGMTQNIGWFVLWVCRWRPAQILGRITFSAYLVHMGIMKLRITLNRQPVYTTDYLLAQNVFGDLVFGYSVATIITLTVEMPFSNFVKMIIK